MKRLYSSKPKKADNRFVYNVFVCSVILSALYWDFRSCLSFPAFKRYKIHWAALCVIAIPKTLSPLDILDYTPWYQNCIVHSSHGM